MNLEITGKLVEKYETQVVSDRFKKREFVLELPDETGNGYINYAKMQLVQTKCDIIDRFNVGDTLRINFNIKGNRVERDGKTAYFSNLDAWRIEKADAGGSNGGGQPGNNYNNNSNSNNGGYNNNYGGGNGNSNNYNNGNNNGGNWNNNNGGGQSGNSNGNWNNGNSGNSGNNAYQNTNANTGGNTAESADDLPF